MPYVQVYITEGATKAQKAELIEGITEVMVRVLEKNPASTHVAIDEHSPANWGIGGRSVKKLRAEGKTAGISKR
jgi:4-oxalocrotonate tautomerase